MIYLLYGADKDKARTKANELVQSLLKKKPDASFFKITSENWNESVLQEYIGSQGLFEQKYIVLLDGLFELKDAKEITLKILKEMKESPHIFIFREGELDKPTLGKFERNAVKVQEFSEKGEAVKKKEFNLFSMTDALGQRDKKNLWVLYQKAKQAGMEDEQIHGTLFWQVKSMIIAAGSKNAGEAKLNPFVFSKASAYAKNFSEEELIKLSGNLVTLYHDSRRGVHDLDRALEGFILEA